MSRRLERNQTGGGTQRGGLRLGRVPWTCGAWRLWEVVGGFGFCGLEDHVGNPREKPKAFILEAFLIPEEKSVAAVAT